MALLASGSDSSVIDKIKPDSWQATLLSEHGFQAPSFPTKENQRPRQHAETLERLVHESSTGRTRTRWFERQEKGKGAEILRTNKGNLTVRTLAATLFPTLTLREQWDETEKNALVHDYLSWAAPRLLTLQDLSDSTRGWLEWEACRQATAVADFCLLYPKILNKKRLDAARVEACLRRASDS